MIQSGGYRPPLIEFSYNNSYQTSIEMAPYEGLYSRPCRPFVYWDEVEEKKILGLELVEATTTKRTMVRRNL